MTNKNICLKIFLEQNPDIKEQNPKTWDIDFSVWIRQQVKEASEAKHDFVYYGSWYDNAILDHNKFDKYLIKKYAAGERAVIDKIHKKKKVEPTEKDLEDFLNKKGPPFHFLAVHEGLKMTGPYGTWIKNNMPIRFACELEEYRLSLRLQTFKDK